jgi:peptidoglycan hydrolase-like protein with peptidoglycan-binding domain
MSTGKVTSTSPSSAPIVPSAPAEVDTATVQQGERSWGELAERLGVDKQALKEANPGLHWPLKVGTQIHIPKGKAAAIDEGEAAASEGTAAAKKGEAAIGEKAKAAGLHAEIPVDKWKATEETLKPGAKGKEVEDLQHQMNEWRKNQYPLLDPIKETGVYDEATKKAVMEFEKRTGLKPDGKADGVMRDELKLRNDPVFKALPKEIQKQITSKMEAAKDDPAARSELMRVVTNEAILKLSSEEQEMMLKMGNGTSDELIAKMKDVAKLHEDKSFMGMNADFRERIISSLFVSNEKEVTDGIMKLVQDDHFAKLPPDVQSGAIASFFLNERDPALTKSLTDFFGSRAFGKLDRESYERIFTAIWKNPDPRLVAELDSLSARKLGKLEDADISSILDRLGIKSE